MRIRKYGINPRSERYLGWTPHNIQRRSLLNASKIHSICAIEDIRSHSDYGQLSIIRHFDYPPLSISTNETV